MALHRLTMALHGVAIALHGVAIAFWTLTTDGDGIPVRQFLAPAGHLHIGYLVSQQPICQSETFP
jgi:hypothetical protein